MTIQRTRAILAISVVGGIVATCTLLVAVPIFSGMQDAEKSITLVKEYSSIFTGVIGTIMGYYFGKEDRSPVPSSASSGQATATGTTETAKTT